MRRPSGNRSVPSSDYFRDFIQKALLVGTVLKVKHARGSESCLISALSADTILALLNNPI